MSTVYRFTESDLQQSCNALCASPARDRRGGALHAPHRGRYPASRELSHHLERTPVATQGAEEPPGFFTGSDHLARLAEHLRTLSVPGALLWSCAASTGQEPYSMAMTAHEALGSGGGPVKILATDVDLRSLCVAERGVYSAEAMRQVPAGYRQRYFTRVAGPQESYQVVPEIRRMVSFLPFDLASAQWPLRGSYDAIFCGEALSLFAPAARRELLERLAARLKPAGLLFSSRDSCQHQG